MKNKFGYVICTAIAVVILFLVYRTVTKAEYIGQGGTNDNVPKEWNAVMANSINHKGISLYVDGVSVNTKKNMVYMDSTMTLMVPSNILRDVFDCSVNLYSEKKLTVYRGQNKLVMEVNSTEMSMNEGLYLMKTPPTFVGDVLYVPIDAIIQGLGYTYLWDMNTNQATMINDSPDNRNLPYAYSYLAENKTTAIKDQGAYGTCWAFASLTALETTLLPEKRVTFAVDHMSIANSFNLSQYAGGEYTMALAYLLAWQGPVLESQDPYGDGKTDETLTSAFHVQSAQIIEAKDFETIKKMVFKYGGVQSSLYMAMSYYGNTSKYYNREESAYCYIGENKPNHDIVIIGWDDNYPKENFNADVQSDGAFICQNSWGSNFGDNGIFYVSYYDTNIGMHNVVYTPVESNTKYDDIYQTDLCGWVGYLGCDREYATFANVYTAQNSELLKAAGFYSVGLDTSYKVYLVRNYVDESSLDGEMIELASGTFKNAGYYTVEFDNIIRLNKDEQYAIVVDINTPNTQKPIAVEYVSDYRTAKVDLSDGQGYIKLGYNKWQRTEDMGNKSCNICLKAYTQNVVSENNGNTISN